MCGIFGFLAQPDATAEVPERELFGALEELFRLAAASAERLAAEAGKDEGCAVIRALEAAGREVYRWLAPGGFVNLLYDSRREHALREAARALRRRVEALQGSAERWVPRDQREWEFVNGVLAGASDILWQLERDLLGKLGPVRALAARALERLEGDSLRSREVLAGAFELNLALDSLDRLEVRGRDSAGIAAYALAAVAMAAGSLLKPKGLKREAAERSGAQEA